MALVLSAAALLALSGIATAKDRNGNDSGGHHGRHHGHHHLREVREAGTVSSFDATTGKLTIALKGGDSVTGLVTDETRIKCEGVDDRLDRRDHGGRGAEPGDDHGGEEGAPMPNPGRASASCGTDSLAPGTFVGDAEVRLGTGAAVFTEIELGHHS